jgi:hypothetical protein
VSHCRGFRFVGTLGKLREMLELMVEVRMNAFTPVLYTFFMMLCVMPLRAVSDYCFSCTYKCGDNTDFDVDIVVPA